MSQDRQTKQATAYRALHTALGQFFASSKELILEDPNDPVTLAMADLHDSMSIEFLKGVQAVLKKANRNFLRVVTDENDPL